MPSYVFSIAERILSRSGVLMNLFFGSVRRRLFQELTELFLVDRLVVSLFRANAHVAQEIHDGVVERLVALLLANLDHAGDLVSFSFADEVRDGHIDNQNLQRRDT